MVESFLKIAQKDMEAVVNTFNMQDSYFPTLFPLKEKSLLTWKAVENVASVKSAADVVAFGTSIKEKERPVFAKIGGDLAKIAIKRKMDEDTLYQYDEIKQYAQNVNNAQILIDLWADDLKFCYDGVINRLEWMTLRTISTGKIKFTGENNAGVVSEYDIDYQMKNKKGYYGTAPWSDKTNAKPLSVDLRQAIKDLKEVQRKNPKFIFMNQDTFTTLCETDEVVKLCASFAANAFNIATTPTLADVNSTMIRLGYLNGAQIVIIDQNIEANEETGNPFVDNVVLITETKNLGETYWKRALDMGYSNPIISRVQRGIVTLKKYGVEEPYSEFTQGIGIAFPVWKSSMSSMLMDVKNSTWNEGN